MPDLSKDSVNRLVIGDDSAGQRIDNYLIRVLKGVPKSHVYRIVRSGEVRVNRHRVGPDVRLALGDEVRVPPIRTGLPNPASPTGQRDRAGLPGLSEGKGAAARAAIATGPVPPVLYEDDAVLALDKPAGLAVHGGSGVSHGLIERLRAARPTARFLELVHRLDRETSGVLLVAKKRTALVDLHAQLREGRTDKRYLALVRGRWRDAVRAVDLPLTKYLTGDGERRVRVERDGQTARTIFRRIRSWTTNPPLALLEAELGTGRTHQIRVHLAHLGFPLAGDDKYGDFAWNRLLLRDGLKRMFLHAQRIRFQHPVTREPMTIAAPLPADLTAFLARLDRDGGAQTIDNREDDGHG